jgi:hypothetical protein
VKDEFGIDSIDPAHYSVADGHGKTTAGVRRLCQPFRHTLLNAFVRERLHVLEQAGRLFATLQRFVAIPARWMQ